MTSQIKTYRLYVYFVLIMLLPLSAYSQTPSNPKEHQELRDGDMGYEQYQKARLNFENDSCVVWADQLREIAINKRFPLAEIYYHRILRRYYFEKNQLNEALIHGKEQARLSKMYGNVLNEAEANAGIVDIYIRENRIMDAFHLCEDMRKQAEITRDNNAWFSSYCASASLFHSRKNYIGSRRQYENILTLRDSLPTRDFVRAYQYISESFPYGNDSTFYYIELGLKDKRTSKLDSIILYSSLMKSYALVGDSKSFYSVWNKMTSMVNKEEFSKEIKWIYNLFNAMFTKNIAEIQKQLDLNGDSYERYTLGYVISKYLDDDQNALDFLEKRSLVSDSINSIISSTDLMEMSNEAKIESSKKDNEYALTVQKNNMRYLVMILTFLVLVVLLFVIINTVINHNRNLEKVSEMKTAFVQNMSHEIRTPLNAIVGFSQLLSLPSGMLTDKEKEEYAGYITSNSNTLTMIVDDILNMSDVQTGDFHVTFESVNCNSTVRSAMKTVENDVPGGVNFYYTSEVDDNYMVTTDTRRVQQVLVNFFTNAFKHTKKGEIHINCSLKENPEYITFSVADTGDGVPADQAEAIFERFTKLDNFQQGAGLGLSICRMIAKKLGGEVKLDTSYTNGARFIFTIPLKAPEQKTNK